MMRPRIVKSANNEEEPQYYEDTLPHVTKVTKEPVMPWANTYIIVCADSYFASVTDAEESWKHRLRFIGVIKTATRKFPRAYLSTIDF